MANQLTEQRQNMGIATYLGQDKVKENIENVIGEKNITRFISSVVSAVQANPILTSCSSASIVSTALQGEALQLAPSPQLGQFYMVPYSSKKKVDNKWVDVKEAQFQLGYKGYIQLAIRSGQYRKIVVSEIKKGECKYNPITEEMQLTPIMNPEEREKTQTVGYYAAFELMNGFKKELYQSREGIENHAKKYSSSYRYDLNNNKKSSVWSTDFDSMAKKTMIRKLIGTWGVMSVEMQQAYERDMSVIDENGNPVYVDNMKNIEDVVVRDIQENANAKSFVEEVEKVSGEVEGVVAEADSTNVDSQEEDVPDWAK